MKLCFYSPYLPTQFGGGEKHLLDVATTAARTHFVTIAISPTFSGELQLDQIAALYEQFYGTSLAGVQWCFTPLGTRHSALSKLNWTRQWDGIYYVTDGSLFFSLARHNYLHIQTPLMLDKSSAVERLKLQNWQYKNTNSYFTKDVIERSWKTSIATVLHPLVDGARLHTDGKQKKKRIISVGRFFKQLHSKRQDIMVESFKELCAREPELLKGWKLQLVGAVEDPEFYAEVTEAAKGQPIEFYNNCPRPQLEQLYKEARIYWHAAGFGKNERTEPEKVEHFGISTAEAMAAGAIPLVVPKGGQKEVVGAELLNLGWTTIDECVTVTREVIQHVDRWKSLSAQARQQAERFDRTRFEAAVSELFAVGDTQ